MMIKAVRILVFLLLVFQNSAILAEDQLDDSSKKLFQMQLELANSGNAQGQFYVGRMYEQGLGTKKDLDMAISWYLRSAQQGFSAAKLRLKLLEKGRRRDLKDEELERKRKADYDRRMALKRKIEAEERRKEQERLEQERLNEQQLRQEERLAAEKLKQSENDESTQAIAADTDANQSPGSDSKNDDNPSTSCGGPKTKFMSGCR